MLRTKGRQFFSVLLMLLILSATLTAQKRDKSKDKEDTSNLPETIWSDSGDLSSLDFFTGAGGKENAPEANGKFTFVKEDAAGTSPKFIITDDQGVIWKVKLGQEPQSETAATRLLWAAGYFVDEDYYLSEFKVVNIPKLKRGGQFVSVDGTVHKARLERKSKEIENLGTWNWFTNPFQGKRELNGLRVMMSLINNWDLSPSNNSIYKINDERRYVVSDLGASFGSTGNNFARSKSSPKDFANSKFIEKSDSEFVDFAMHSRPFVLSAVNVSNYKARTRMEDITKHIPRADAKWLGQRLSQLSEEQVSDCFRAAGYTSAEIAIYTQAVRKRIAELNAL